MAARAFWKSVAVCDGLPRETTKAFCVPPAAAMASRLPVSLPTPMTYVGIVLATAAAAAETFVTELLQSFGSPSVASTTATLAPACIWACDFAYAIAPSMAGSVGVPPLGEYVAMVVANDEEGRAVIATAGVS